MADLDFSGKCILVTGGGAGIGRAIAEAFGQRGAAVAIAEIDAARLRDTEQTLKERGIDVLALQADVTRRADVERVMAAVEERFGGLDVLVNNVGDFLGIVKPFEHLSDDEIDQVYAVNLKSVFLVTHAAIPSTLR